MGEHLNPKQVRFIAAYLKTANATEAAIKAGYSPKTAKQQGSRLLTRADVRRVIEQGHKDAGVTPEIVLGELLRIARADISQAIDEAGRLKPVHEMPEDVRRAIAGIEVEKLFEGRGEDREQIGTLHKVKFWDKTRGLEMLGRYLGMFKDKVEVSGKLTFAELVLAAQRKREEKP